MANIILVDFDDSFTHNLVSLFESLGHHVDFLHWAKLSQEKLDDYELVVLGPGPGHHSEYVAARTILKNLKEQKVLGVCLGHQILLDILGGQIKQLQNPLHGTSLELPEVSQFFGISDFKAQFYNSWFMNKDSLSFLDEFATFDEMVVYFHHDSWAGVQFHPESVGTTCPKSFTRELLRKLGV